MAQALRDARADVLVELPARRLRRRPAPLRPGLPRRRRGLRERHPRLHRQRPDVGRPSSATPACPSSATTSRARWARPSSTGSSPGCSRTAASPSTAPTSSTSAATWTSRTCSSASGSSRRRSPRPRPSPARSRTTSLDADDVHIGPSDHVPWLEDRKWAYIRMEGRNFGDVPLNLELKLEVWDSPNSAGVIIDAVRCAKLALDRGIGGPLLGPSAYFMKSPPVQYHDDEAHRMVEDFAARRRDPAGPRTCRPTPEPRDSTAAVGGPPRVQAPAGLFFAQRALFQAELEQEVERLAHDRARGQTQVVHDLAAVELGADGVELLSRPQLDDAALELVHALRRGPGPWPRCGWCSRTGSARSAGRAGARRRGRSGARPGRSSPAGRCGSAGAARPAAVTISMSSLRVAQRRHAGRGSSAPRPPRGGGR